MVLSNATPMYQPNTDNGPAITELSHRLPSIISCTDLTKESSTSYSGPCRFCGGTDRFVYKTDSGRWWCRSCRPPEKFPPGDVIDFHCRLSGKELKDLFREYLPENSTNWNMPTSPREDSAPVAQAEPLPDFTSDWNRCSTQAPGVIKNFLCGLRKIDAAVVDSLIESGQVRTKNHAGKNSLVFPFRTLQGDGIPALQYISADGAPFPFTEKNGSPANKVFGKGSKPGSDCFFMVGQDVRTAKMWIICEAAINAITAHQHFPDACCIAIGGSTYVSKVKALKPYLSDVEKVVVAVDHDNASEKMLKSIWEILPEKLYSFRWSPEDPPGFDINDALRRGQPNRIVDLIQSAEQVWYKVEAPEQDHAQEDALIPLPDDLPPVQPFDYDLLPDALRPWIMDISERMQCPPDFVAAAVMTAIAAVIGRKVGIRPQARTDWTVVCNLWALIVGRPGVLKSPAQEAGLAPLKRLIAEANDLHQSAEEQYKIEALTAKLRQEAAEKTARKMLAKDPEADLSAVLAVDEEPVSPVLKRYQANDCTPASLGELLRQNPNGLLVFRDEVVSLLKSLDRDGQEEGRGFYLTAWNGDSPYTFDRIGRGLNLTIPAICLSLLGGTQPGRLSEYIYHAVKGGAADDGLIQRFGIMVWPDIPKKWKNVDRTPDREAKNQAYQVFTHLDKLTPDDIQAEQDTDANGQPDGIPYLRFDPAALELFTEWRADLESRLRSDDMIPALESHFSKYRKLVPSLALIFHLVDGGVGPVTETATLRALAWSQYLESHAYRAYGSITSPEVSTAKAILKKIQQGKLKSGFVSRDVWRPGWSKLTDRDQVVEGLKILEDYGWITAEEIPTKGRPKTVYHYNGGNNE